MRHVTFTSHINCYLALLKLQSSLQQDDHHQYYNDVLEVTEVFLACPMALLSRFGDIEKLLAGPTVFF